MASKSGNATPTKGSGAAQDASSSGVAGAPEASPLPGQFHSFASLPQSVGGKTAGSKVGSTANVRSMDTAAFLEYRQRTSVMFGLPSQFFKSRAELRTWGVEELTDPAVQPYDPKDPNLPNPFHTTLPGYSEQQCQNLIAPSGEAGQRSGGPTESLTTFMPTWTPHFTPNPNFPKQRIGYDWQQQPCFTMDKHPYVNAFFEPQDPEAHSMYNQMIPWTAYPYGVPM